MYVRIVHILYSDAGLELYTLYSGVGLEQKPFV